MSDGWIKLHRKLLDDAMMKKSQYLHLWIVLLLEATHKKVEFICNGKKKTLRPGQLLTSRKRLCMLTGIEQRTIERILDYFENEQQIAQQTTNKFRILTINNWQNYQTAAQQTHSSRTSTAQQLHTYNNDKNEKKGKNERTNSSIHEENYQYTSAYGQTIYTD